MEYYQQFTASLKGYEGQLVESATVMDVLTAGNITEKYHLDTLELFYDVNLVEFHNSSYGHSVHYHQQHMSDSNN